MTIAEALRTRAGALLQEAAFAEADKSFGAIQSAIQRALADETEGTTTYSYVADVYDAYFVQAEGGHYYRRDYTLNADGTAALGADRTEVIPETIYNDMAEGQRVEERRIPKAELDKAKASDFAGKERSFAILAPEDVSAAARSIGRAGGDNFSPDQLRRNIIRIAKRKGAEFVAKLPKAWRDGMAEAAGDVAEADADLTGDMVSLVERAVSSDGTVRIKLIQPGWGSSGYYPKAVLERDGPKVFGAGTKMFLDHPTPAEEAQRPEGSLQTLAASLATPAKFEEDAKHGPGLYAMAHVGDRHKQFIEDFGPQIGVSIRASGKGRMGEAEGREGLIISSLLVGKSVDFVTEAGAGGRVLELYESARTPVRQEDSSMTPEQEKALKEAGERATAAEATIAKLQVGLRLAEAERQVGMALRDSGLPEVAQQRLMATLPLNPPATADGSLDRTQLGTRISEAIKAEHAYVVSLSGNRPVRGMGEAGAVQTREVKPEDLAAQFVRLGMSESAAKVAATGRA